MPRYDFDFIFTEEGRKSQGARLNNKCDMPFLAYSLMKRNNLRNMSLVSTMYVCVCMHI